MSRTIRRKGTYPLTAYVGLPEEIDSYDMERYGAKTVQECIQKKKAWFHGDSHRGSWNPPSWFCRQRNRRIGRENRAELHRCLTLGEWDDHQPVRYIKDAGYLWW